MCRCRARKCGSAASAESSSPRRSLAPLPSSPGGRRDLAGPAAWNQQTPLLSVESTDPNSMAHAPQQQWHNAATPARINLARIDMPQTGTAAPENQREQGGRRGERRWPGRLATRKCRSGRPAGGLGRHGRAAQNAGAAPTSGWPHHVVPVRVEIRALDSEPPLSGGFVPAAQHRRRAGARSGGEGDTSGVAASLQAGR